MNRAQEIVAESYCNGELNNPEFQNMTAEEIYEELSTCDDGLFRFLLNEVSDEEDCKDVLQAWNRTHRAIEELRHVLRALNKEITDENN